MTTAQLAINAALARHAAAKAFYSDDDANNQAFLALDALYEADGVWAASMALALADYKDTP